MTDTTTAAKMCDCGNDTVIPGTRLCKSCAWAGQAYPHLFPQDALNAEIDALRKENANLRAKNAAQSDMLRQAVKASGDWMNEITALNKLIGGVLMNLDNLSPMECMTRLMAMRREYAEIVAEGVHE